MGTSRKLKILKNKRYFARLTCVFDMYMSIRLFINYYNLMEIDENSRLDNSWERS